MLIIFNQSSTPWGQESSDDVSTMNSVKAALMCNINVWKTRLEP